VKAARQWYHYPKRDNGRRNPVTYPVTIEYEGEHEAFESAAWKMGFPDMSSFFIFSARLMRCVLAMADHRQQQAEIEREDDERQERMAEIDRQALEKLQRESGEGKP
jgi:hypothetical protein